MSDRKTSTNFTCSYRLVLEYPWGTKYKGPYQTYSAAKGQLTQETKYTKEVTGWVEQTPDDAWERV